MTQSVSQEAKCFNTPNLDTTKTHFSNTLINIGSISFFSSSDMRQSHYLWGCHVTGINSSLNSFFKFFVLSRFNMPSQKCDKNNNLKIIFIKFIIKINIININIKNTHSSTIKYGITRTLIEVEYIFTCIQSSKRCFSCLT